MLNEIEAEVIYVSHEKERWVSKRESREREREGKKGEEGRERGMLLKEMIVEILGWKRQERPYQKISVHLIHL